jgi:hypothetical protein
MDRTHSIMRIATTASPISGDAVRERMETMRLEALILNSVRVIIGAWHRHQKRHFRKLKSDRHICIDKDSVGSHTSATESSHIEMNDESERSLL